MNSDGTVYFIGAGASRQDKFPLTSELKHGIAWAILKEPSRFDLLRYHLKYLYHVFPNSLKQSAVIWYRLCAPKNDSKTPRCQIPDVTDLLSSLDWIIREQSSFGPSHESRVREKRAKIDQLPEVRDLVVQALCYSLGIYHDNHKAHTAKRFINQISPTNSLITTNWDLLLDKARHKKFGTLPEDYGTTGEVHLGKRKAPTPTMSERPKLLKLHGSLSWRYCQRCQRLVIDPMHHVAGDREARTCECICTYKYSELIVTPGFVREYRNLHLLNIWREALVALANASHWVFIGYSLPADDVGIQTLLLKARCVRTDRGYGPPHVTIVTGRDGTETQARYRRILAKAELFQGDFCDYVMQMDATS
jgi:hypothetical protein